jgi:ADP-heptose:LPS heptosyltransferase
VDTVYVLSRVTLGADIKIVSPILDAMRARFPGARIVFVSNRKSAELFRNDRKLEFLNVDYPRGGSMRERIECAEGLRRQLRTPNRIVLDPDSRMTQLGLLPACEPERVFHFPSRTAGEETSTNLSNLVSEWLTRTFGLSGAAWIAPDPVGINAPGPIAAVSFGVGENDAKSLGIDFEAQCIRKLAESFRTIYLDRGAGGAEAERVTEAARASEAAEKVRFWEGSFAGFASIIAQSRFYAGYDSAGQHAAAAAGTPLVTFFRGAPSRRFRQRWAPQSPSAHIVDADSLTPHECLRALSTVVSGLL